MPLDSLEKVFLTLINHRNVDTVISKLRRRAKECNKDQVDALVTVISRLGNNFPNPPALFDFLNPFAQGAMLINVFHSTHPAQ